MKAIKPKNGQKVGVVALVSAPITRTTNRTDVLGDLGGIGSTVLQLPKGKAVAGNSRPEQRVAQLELYLCIARGLGPSQGRRTRWCSRKLQGKASGGYALWLTTEIALI